MQWLNAAYCESASALSGIHCMVVVLGVVVVARVVVVFEHDVLALAAPPW